MAAQLLLLEDVDTLGRKGDVVHVKPGYARNFLLPQGLAITADKHALRRQERLKEERQKKAAVDKQESEEVASRIEGIVLTKVVKVDHDGHMYGSVNAAEIAHLLLETAQVEVERKALQLRHPIKATGIHEIHVKLKEGVVASFSLKVMSEEGHRKAMEEESAAQPQS